MTRSVLGPIILYLAMLPLPGNAATYRVDDSATLPGDANVKMRWRTFGPQRNGSIETVDGSSIVTIRLNTAPWQKRVGKIYMSLSTPPSGPVQVDWTTQGRLLSGSLISGNRTLVYAGLIQSEFLEDNFNVQVHADGLRLNTAQRLQFYFEIDVE